MVMFLCGSLVWFIGVIVGIFGISVPQTTINGAVITCLGVAMCIRAKV